MDKVWDKIGREHSKKKDIIAKIGDMQQKHIERLLDKHICLKKDMRVLDAGCGNGRWSFWFSRQVKDVVGIDSSKELLSLAKKEGARKNLNNIKFIEGDIEKLPFTDSTFDITFTCIVLQHIIPFDKFKRTAKELLRVTKKGGLIVMFEIVRKQEKKRENYIACRPVSEYEQAFSRAQMKKHIGVRFPYLLYALMFALKKVLVKKKQGDVRDTYALWEALEKSRLSNLAKALFLTAYYASVPVNKLSSRMSFLSPERIMIFEK